LRTPIDYFSPDDQLAFRFEGNGRLGEAEAIRDAIRYFFAFRAQQQKRGLNMSASCTVCAHSKKAEIDAELSTWPRRSLRELGEAFGLSKDALSRHFRAHLPKAPAPWADAPDYREQVALAKQRHEPVRFSGDVEREAAPAPPSGIVREVWPVCGRLYTVECAAPGVPSPPQIEPTIKRGIPYTWPQRYSTWED
jgi:hypothetical protein